MPAVVVIVCAISAGIHAALTPEHFREGVGPGGGFLAATIVLIAVAVALTRRQSTVVMTVAGLTLAVLIGSYALAVTTGEPIDALAVVTKAIEALGLVALIPFRPKGATAR